MSNAYHTRPPEPLVARNPFRGRTPAAPAIPTFADARRLLPEPVVPERPEWQEMYWRAWEIAWSRLRRPRPGSGFVSAYLEAPAADYLSAWESAFISHFGLYGRRAFPFINTLDNFYGRQHDDGFIGRELHTQTGQDATFPFDPDSATPLILGWTEWRYYRLAGDDGRLAEVFWPLLALHRWSKANRTWPTGLYWATGRSSGMDNQNRVPGGERHHRHWAWADANLQACLNRHALSHIAGHIHEESIAGELGMERDLLCQHINNVLWSKETAFYHDVDATGRFSPVKSVGAYWALLDPEIVPADRLPDFLRHLRELSAFKRPHRVPSLSADSEGYDATSGDRWRGGVWPHMNYMILKGLRACGQHALAHEIAVNHLEHVAAVYRRSDTLWEYYAPEAAEPGDGARPDYVGWTGLSAIATLLEDAIGLHVDWPTRQVTWDRRLNHSAPYGVRHYPLGSEGSLDMLGDSEKTTIMTDVAFTLTVHDGERTVRRAIPVGATEIEMGD